MSLSTQEIISQQETQRRQFIISHPELGEFDLAKAMQRAQFYPDNTKFNDIKAHIRRFRDFVDNSSR